MGLIVDEKDFGFYSRYDGKSLEGVEQGVTFSNEEENCSLSVLCHVTSQCFILLNIFWLQIVYAERPLTDNHRSLASYGLKDGDVVILRQKENADPRPSVQFPSTASHNGFTALASISR